MKAHVLRTPAPAARHPLVLEERPTPVPGPGELRVRVAACAVCRTDLQLVEGDLGSRRLPVVPGHQVVGYVTSHGPEVSAPGLGTRVGISWLAGSCGECRFCRSHRENLCTEATFTGWDRDGGFAEEMVVRADVVTALPEGPDTPGDVDLAPLLCGGVIGYRSLRVAGVEPGGRLGLFGFGASATCVIQVARHWGCEVYVATRSPAEQERARNLGAAWVGSYDEPVPEPLDAAITFAPAGEVVLAALRAVDRGGTVAVNAIHLDRIPSFPYEWLWWERSLRSVANVTRRDVRELLTLATEIPIVTHVDVYPFESANDTLVALAESRVRGAAVLAL